MSDPLQTIHLDLPYIAPAQAQKHVTHNEALRLLDTVVQLAVLDSSLAAPPASPDEGDRYIVADAATDEWDGHDREVATFVDGGWAFAVAEPGWIAFDLAASAVFVFVDGAWQAVGGFLGAIDMLGINATADGTNRLAVRSNAVLFSDIEAADGGTGDIRFVVNKETDANTASFLFQSGLSGRAEVGLAGDTDFIVKVSADGSAWTEAIRIDKDTGLSAILYDNGSSGLAAATVQDAIDEVAADEAATAAALSGKQAADADLTVLAGLSSTGIAVRSAADTWVQRSLAASTGLSVANASGAAGDPTVALDANALTEDTAPDVTADFLLSYDASAADHKKVKPASLVRRRLAANESHYVRTDGSDSNTGLADNAGGAFLTVQAATDNIARNIDLNGYTVTIFVRSGTYAGGVDINGPWVGKGTVALEGDTTTPGNVILQTTGSTTVVGLNGGARLTIRGFKLQSSSGSGVLFSATSSIVSVDGKMEYGATTGVHIAAANGAAVTITANYTINGNGSVHFQATNGAAIICRNRTITLSGTPAFSSRFAYAFVAGTLQAEGNTFSGSATGTRYKADVSGVIFTSGAGANYFPGNAAGSAINGGNYV